MKTGKNRWSLEDVSKKSQEIQRQVAAALYGDHVAREIKSAGKELDREMNAEVDKIIRDVFGEIPSEHASQVALINWWHFEALKRGIPEKKLMAFPLAGKRTKASGGRLKAEGMRKGTLDMFLAIKRGERGGLWIELKTEAKGSKLSASQKEMLKLLSEDYCTVVCRSEREARHVITAYLEMK